MNPRLGVGRVVGGWAVNEYVVVALLGGRAGAGRSCSSISTTEVCCAFLQFCDNLPRLQKKDKSMKGM